MTYLSDVADEIMRELPPRLVPEEDGSEDLMLVYAGLSLSLGSSVTAASGHGGTAWMTARGEQHSSIVPFEELSPDVKAEDEPIAEAIRRVAGRRV